MKILVRPQRFEVREWISDLIPHFTGHVITYPLFFNDPMDFDNDFQYVCTV